MAEEIHQLAEKVQRAAHAALDSAACVIGWVDVTTLLIVYHGIVWHNNRAARQASRKCES